MTTTQTAGQKAAETRRARAAAKAARSASAKAAAVKATAAKRAKRFRYASGYVHSVAWALEQFCGAVASDGRFNHDIIESVMGATIARPSPLDTVDAATYDAVSTRSGTPCRTFREAFAACFPSSTVHGHRYWKDLDLQTLQDCHPDFAAFRLPEWVEQQMVEEQLAEHYREMGDELATDAQGEDEVCDAALETSEEIPF